MRAEDLKKLGPRLEQIAASLGQRARAPSQEGLIVFLDVLKDIPMPEIESVLVDYPKRFAKVPAPADIFRECSARLSDRLERQAEALAREPILRPTQFPVASAAGREQMQLMRKVVRRQRPDHRDWIERIDERRLRNDPTLGSYALKLAAEAKTQKIAAW